MPRTIVCGVDQSDAAKGVLNTARWVANHLKERLCSLTASWPGRPQ
jgi:hypothetical protein